MMGKFKDKTGREWNIEIPTWGTVLKLRKETGFDLNRIAHDTHALYMMVEGDFEELLRPSWMLIEGQHPITQEEFYDCIDSQAVQGIRVAMADAVFDFFHRGRAGAIKENLRAILAGITTSTGSTGDAASSPASAA